MSIDNGPSTTDRLLDKKYIKTSTQGFTFTREGIEWLTQSLQEIYYAIAEIHQELESSRPVSDDPSRNDGEGHSV